MRYATLTFLPLLLAACSDGRSDPPMAPEIPPGQLLTTEATVRFLPLEGGCWVLEVAPGTRYEPVNLAQGFRTDGLKVHAVLRDAPNTASICMVGPLVSIDSIGAP